MAETFSSRVLELALSIPPGRVTTYGALAKAAGGGAMAARSVTSILSKYPNQKAIPYHRIVYAGGKIWSNETCGKDRVKLFKREGVTVDERGQIKDFEEIFTTQLNYRETTDDATESSGRKRPLRFILDHTQLEKPHSSR